ncbi:bifunctional YncE family protein/alkaline phosphatase family protein [Myxococcota bacterium]|nr:bifunctional YncE family protein/alkaline phosphatase family protein [Myxococcota bacterium]
MNGKRRRNWTGWMVVAATVIGCSRGGDPVPVARTEGGITCRALEMDPEAWRKAGPDPSGHRAVLHNGRVIAPVGTRFPTADFPLGFALNRDETRAYVVHNGDGRSLMVLDLTAAPAGQDPAVAPERALMQTVPLGSTFRGVALTPDEKTLVVAGGNTSRAWFLPVLPDGTLATPGEFASLSGYLSDLVIAPDGSEVFVLSNTNSKVFVLDPATRETRRVIRTEGATPYALVISPDGSVLWASNQSSDTVTAIDARSGALLARIAVGKGPEAMALSPDGSRLFVALSDADRVAVIDTSLRVLLETWDLTGDPAGLAHGNVNGIAVSPDGKRVFVTAAAMNRVDVVDSATGRVLGSVPTGWYPTEVQARGDRLYAVSSKGMANPNPRALKTIPGFLGVVAMPDDETLARWTEEVARNNDRARAFLVGSCTPDRIPVLKGPPESPIRHVILIVRENKTYDMLLGDLTDHQGNPIGDGDPNLVVFGERYTPNFHELSREFATFDNFYSNAEASLHGHQWVTQSQCNDLMEKEYPDQLPIPGIDPGLDPDGEWPTFFDLLYEHDVPFRNYGEFPSFGLRMLDEFQDFYDHKYPFWTQSVWDVDKAAEVIREWELGIVPSFIFIGLPNDHTYGTRKGFPTPATMVADNDRGTGRLIEWISHSPYWPETVVFILEDDPQGSGDHVEAHRSVLTVVSPWVRRHYISSLHYDVPSVFRTIELILGLPPMGKNDAYAPPILDIWVDGTSEPIDTTPFLELPVDVPYEVNGAEALMAAESEACDFRVVDSCPGLGRILWKAMRGNVEPPPYAKGIDK